MAEPNQDQPIEPTEPERYQTETDDVSESSTSSGGDVQVAPQVHVEPPLTKTRPPIFYIPIGFPVGFRSSINLNRRTYGT